MVVGRPGLMENVTGIAEKAKKFTGALVPTRNLKEMESPVLGMTSLLRIVI